MLSESGRSLDSSRTQQLSLLRSQSDDITRTLTNLCLKCPTFAWLLSLPSLALLLTGLIFLRYQRITPGLVPSINLIHLFLQRLTLFQDCLKTPSVGDRIFVAAVSESISNILEEGICRRNALQDSVELAVSEKVLGDPETEVFDNVPDVIACSNDMAGLVDVTSLPAG
jgi:hypothetical protein